MHLVDGNTVPVAHTQVADPLGGSYYIEALTDQMVKSAEAIIQEIEDIGGMTEAIIAGINSLFCLV